MVALRGVLVLLLVLLLCLPLDYFWLYFGILSGSYDPIESAIHRGVGNMEVMVHIGGNLKRLRLRSALTQRELAQRAGIAHATLARLERNKAEPHPTTMRKLADALGVEPRELVEGE